MEPRCILRLLVGTGIVLSGLLGAGPAGAQKPLPEGPPPYFNPLSPKGLATVSSTSSEGALFLLLPVGAQGVALGRTMTAVQTPEAAFWNPAGLSRVDESRFVVYRGDHFAGEATTFSILLTDESLGTVGISYQLLDIGDQDLTDEQGNVVGGISVRNHLAVISASTSLLEHLAAGLNFKVLQFRADCTGACLDPGVTATSYAIDAGLQARPVPGIPLRLGAMVAHLGPNLQFVNAEQADPLPTRIRVSAGYEVLHHATPGDPYSLWIAVEAEDRWHDPGSPRVYMGSEFSVGSEDVVFVRAGYQSGTMDEDGGASVGMGVRYRRFDVGIAKSFAGPSLSGESEPFHVTFGITF